MADTVKTPAAGAGNPSTKTGNSTPTKTPASGTKNKTNPKKGVQSCSGAEKIQLIPARYALAEHESSIPFIKDKYNEVTKGFRPVAGRLFQYGFLYFVHSCDLNVLHEYEIFPGGKVKKIQGSGEDKIIVLPKEGKLELYYCDIRMSEFLRNKFLKESEYRKLICQTVNLAFFTKGAGARDLLPLDQAAEEIAESRNDPRDPGLFSRMQSYSDPAVRITPMPGNEEEPPYFWETSFTPTTASALKQLVIPECQDTCALLMVEDPVGIMDDLTLANKAVLKREEDFRKENGAKHEAAVFLSGLYTGITPESIRNLAISMEEERRKQARKNAALKTLLTTRPSTSPVKDPLGGITDEELQIFIDRWEDAVSVSDAEIYATTIGIIHGMDDDGAYDITRHTGKKYQLRKEVKEKHKDLEAILDEAFTRRKYLLEGAKPGEKGISELINLAEMQSWYEEHKIRHQALQDELEAIDVARSRILDFCRPKIFGYDTSDPKIFSYWQGKDLLWTFGLGISANPKAVEAVENFYLKELGPQNILLYMDAFAYRAKEMTDLLDLVQGAAAVIMQGGASVYKETKLSKINKKVKELNALHAQKSAAITLNMVEGILKKLDGMNALQSAPDFVAKALDQLEYKGLRAMLSFDILGLARSGHVSVETLAEAARLYSQARQEMIRVGLQYAQMDLFGKMRLWFNKVIQPTKNRLFADSVKYDAACHEFLKSLQQFDEGIHSTRIHYDIHGSARKSSMLIAEKAAAELRKIITRAGNTHLSAPRIEEFRSIYQQMVYHQYELNEICNAIRDTENVQERYRITQERLMDLEMRHTENLVQLKSKMNTDLSEALQTRTSMGVHAEGLAAAGLAAASTTTAGAGNPKLSFRAGVNQAGLPGALAIVCWCIAIADIRDLGEAVGTGKEFFHVMQFLSSGCMAISATASASVVFWASGLGLDTKAAQSHKLISKLGVAEKWGLRLMGRFGILAVAFASVGHGKMAFSGDTKNRLAVIGASSVAIFGDAMQIWGLYRAVKYADDAKGLIGFFLGARGANVIMLLGSALVYWGTWLYNSVQRTPLQAWAENCSWGKENKNWSRGEQGLALGEVLCTPEVRVYKVWPVGATTRRLEDLEAIELLFRIPNIWMGTPLDIGQIRVFGIPHWQSPSALNLAGQIELECVNPHDDPLEFTLRIKKGTFLQKIDKIYRSLGTEIHLLLHHPDYPGTPMYAPAGLLFREFIFEDPNARDGEDFIVMEPLKSGTKTAGTGPFLPIKF